MNRFCELTGQGWVKQSILDEPRLSECVELYESIGFEVLLEPVRPQYLEGECSECFTAAPDRYKVIFTKSSQKAPAL